MKIATKLIIVTCLAAVLLCVATYWIFSIQVRTIIKSDLENKTNTILKNLAYNSEYSMIIRDAASLENQMEGVLTKKDISFIAIEDARGNTVEKKIKSAERTNAEFTAPIVSKLLFSRAR